jgi:hypothetical protein
MMNVRAEGVPAMVDNQGDLLNRFPLLESIIRNLSCNDADKQLLLTLFLNVYLTGRKDCQDTHLKQ